jgi:hypothetical protein
MKKIFSISIIFSLMLFFTACDKLLDLEPYQNISEELSLESDANVKSVLKGAYAQFDDLSIYGGCILRNAELLGGANELLWVGTYGGPRQIFNKQMNSSNEDATAQWIDSYEVVNIANNVLSALAVVDEADRERVEGEALFLRSLMFFDLVRFYAQQYQAGSASTQPGIPLVLTPTRGISEESFVSRNSVEEVYNATSGAATALLARVYLQKGDYAKARDAANSVIGSGLYELIPDYAGVFNNDNNSSEDIFATQITPQDRLSSMTEFFSTTEFGGRDGDIEILEGHLNLYSPGDERRDLFWLGNGGMRSGKWNNLYGVVNLIRLAEMYLIRAECNQRLGTAIGATPVNDFNAIHTRAKLAPVATVTLAQILLERRLELSFEGHRIHDQRRLHENVGTLLYTDPKLVFPIPFRETEANPNLKSQQNPGY